MASKMKKVTVVTATIDFGDWKISATGQYEERNWRIEVDYKNPMLSPRYWTEDQYFYDDQELEEFLWEEVERLNKKYSSCVFEETEEEVEDDNYEEDEEN